MIAGDIIRRSQRAFLQIIERAKEKYKCISAGLSWGRRIKTPTVDKDENVNAAGEV